MAVVKRNLYLVEQDLACRELTYGPYFTEAVVATTTAKLAVEATLDAAESFGLTFKKSWLKKPIVVGELTAELDVTSVRWYVGDSLVLAIGEMEG